MNPNLSDRMTATGFTVTFVGLMALLLMQNFGEEAEETIRPFIIGTTVIGAIVLAIGRLSPVSNATPDHPDRRSD